MSKGTSLQIPWMKDLPEPTVKDVKAAAVEATEAWNSTVGGILKAAKAIHRVREQIGGHGSGSFSAWAEETTARGGLGRSRETASHLAVIGARHDQFGNMLPNLPPSWGTLYELAKAPDEVFEIVLPQVRPETTRAELIPLIQRTQQELRKAQEPVPKPPSPKRRRDPSPAPNVTPIVPQPVPFIPKDAAKRVIADWKRLYDRTLIIHAETQRCQENLSKEAKQFITHKYLAPLRKLLQDLEKWET